MGSRNPSFREMNLVDGVDLLTCFALTGFSPKLGTANYHTRNSFEKNAFARPRLFQTRRLSYPGKHELSLTLLPELSQNFFRNYPNTVAGTIPNTVAGTKKTPRQTRVCD